MMSHEANGTVACYYCSHGLDAAPPGRLDQCPQCGKYIHVCRMCRYFDPTETSKQCSEDDAEKVQDKQAANFCDYFTLTDQAFEPAAVSADRSARAELAQLFGDAPASAEASSPDDAQRLIDDAEALFRK